MKWKNGQDTYHQLVNNISQWVASSESEGVGEFNRTEKSIIQFAKTIIPEFIEGLRISDLISIHEYLMYMSEVRPDPRFPVYEYSGGDRIISVTRYLLKNIDLELAKNYV